MRNTRRTRRTLLIALTATGALVSVAACGSGSGSSSSSGDSKTYAFWDPYPQFDASSDWGKRVAQCGTQAGVTIKRTAYDTTDLGNKALLAAQQGNPPDVMLVDNPVVSTLVEAGILNKTSDLGLDTSSIQKNIIGAGTLDGAAYGIPVGANTLALYYNKKILAAAQVDPASVKDWASLTSALKKVKAAGKKGITFSAINTEEGSFQFLPWFWGRVGISPSSTLSRGPPRWACGSSGWIPGMRPRTCSTTRRRRVGRSSPPGITRSVRTGRGSSGTRTRRDSGTGSSTFPRGTGFGAGAHRWGVRDRAGAEGCRTV